MQILKQQIILYFFNAENVEISNNLLVNGDVSLNANVDISGNLKVTSDVSFNGDVEISRNLKVTGDASFNGNVDISGKMSINDTLIFSNTTAGVIADVDAIVDGTNGGTWGVRVKQDGGSLTERIRINNVGAIGIGGANYGTSGQVIVSNNSGSAVSWANQTDTTYSAGTGVNINGSNVISIGQSVGTGDSPRFNKVTTNIVEAISFTGDLYLGYGPAHSTHAGGSPAPIVIIKQANVNQDQIIFHNRNNADTIRFNPWIGRITCASLIQYSDRRNKTNIRQIADATETLKKLTPYRYCLHTGINVDTARHEELQEYCIEESGLVAQEVESDCPELDFTVITKEDGMKSMNYISIIPYLIKSIQELEQRIATLEAQ